MKFIKRFKRQWLNDDVIMGLFIVALGILFCLNDSEVANISVTILGISTLVLAAIAFCWGDLRGALAKAIVGGIIVLISFIFNTQPILLPIIIFVYVAIQIIDCVFLLQGKRSFLITKILAILIAFITFVLALILILPIPYNYFISSILFMFDGLMMFIKGATKKI